MMLVFQYGSNMSAARINGSDRLCGDAQPVGIAKTRECFELDFTVWSKSNCCAAADIVPDKGVNIWGVLYDVPNHLIFRSTAGARKSLDQIEGEGTNYTRIEIPLVCPDGRELQAATYVVKNREFGRETSKEYVKHILTGAIENHLPSEYFQYVLSRVIRNNPNLSLVPYIRRYLNSDGSPID